MTKSKKKAPQKASNHSGLHTTITTITAASSSSDVAQQNTTSNVLRPGVIKKFADLELMVHRVIISHYLNNGIIPAIYISKEFKNAKSDFSISDDNFWSGILKHFTNGNSSEPSFKNHVLEIIKFMRDHGGHKQFDKFKNGDNLWHYAARYDILELANYLEREKIHGIDQINSDGYLPIQLCKKDEIQNTPAAQKLYKTNPTLKLTETGKKINALKTSDLHKIYLVSNDKISQELVTVTRTQLGICKKFADFFEAILSGKITDLNDFAVNVVEYCKEDSAEKKHFKPLINSAAYSLLILSSIFAPNVYLTLFDRFLLTNKEELITMVFSASNEVLRVHSKNDSLNSETIKFLDVILDRLMQYPDFASHDVSDIISSLAQCFNHYASIFNIRESTNIAVKALTCILFNTADKINKGDDKECFLAQFVSKVLTNASLVGDYGQADKVSQLMKTSNRKALSNVFDLVLAVYKGEESVNDIFAGCQDRALLDIFLRDIAPKVDKNFVSTITQDASNTYLNFSIELCLWVELLFGYAITNDKLEDAKSMQIFFALYQFTIKGAI